MDMYRGTTQALISRQEMALVPIVKTVINHVFVLHKKEIEYAK